MERLLEFLKSKGHLLLFLVLETVALGLLLKGSSYRRNVFLSSANVLSGTVTEVAHRVSAYTSLQEENVELMKRNADLEREVLRLRNRISRLAVDTLSRRILMQDSVEAAFPYEYQVARVVGSSLFNKRNTLTINRGSADGIQPDMGVLGSNGIVGVVEAVGQKYSRVIPVINADFSISCVVGKERAIGSLRWNGGSIKHSQLTNISKHVTIADGDSVFTSGYSAIFPEHIFVGIIDGMAQSENDEFYALNVKLNTTFENIKYVYVLKNYELPLRQEVEDPEVILKE